MSKTKKSSSSLSSKAKKFSRAGLAVLSSIPTPGWGSASKKALAVSVSGSKVKKTSTKNKNQTNKKTSKKLSSLKKLLKRLSQKSRYGRMYTNARKLSSERDRLNKQEKLKLAMLIAVDAFSSGSGNKQQNQKTPVKDRSQSQTQGQWDQNNPNNWILNNMMLMEKEAKTEEERKKWEKEADVLRQKLRNSGIPDEKIMQKWDSVIPKEEVMERAWESTEQWVEEDRLGFGLYVVSGKVALEILEQRTGGKKFKKVLGISGNKNKSSNQKGNRNQHSNSEKKESSKGTGNFVKVNNETIISSATAAKKGGETVVGHALQKHAGRNPDIWGKVKGGPNQINQSALNHLKEIINAPVGFTKVTNPKGIQFLEKKLPDGRGVRLNMDGTFKGFIDQ